MWTDYTKTPTLRQTPTPSASQPSARQDDVTRFHTSKPQLHVKRTTSNIEQLVQDNTRWHTSKPQLHVLSRTQVPPKDRAATAVRLRLNIHRHRHGIAPFFPTGCETRPARATVTPTQSSHQLSPGSTYYCTTTGLGVGAGEGLEPPPPPLVSQFPPPVPNKLHLLLLLLLLPTAF